MINKDKAREALFMTLMDLIIHREKMPTEHFTPAEFRKWRREKEVLLEAVWTATVRKDRKETIREALQPKEVDVEALKVTVPTEIDSRNRYEAAIHTKGWNDCLDFLHQQGHLSPIPDGLLKFEGLDEALKVASIGRKTSGHGETDPCINFVWGHERQAELILKAAKAYNDLIQAAKGGE